MNRLIAWVCASRVRQAVLLAAVCCAVYLPGLGSTGLSMSEGHRVIPAWEMLDDARAGEPHWMVPRMFETAYLRKPPGMMWAIAASSAVFGETEFAARLPSAIASTLLAVAVWGFGTRWFGSPWGLAAGLAQALLPVLWPSARSAEIESLHVLTTGLAALLVIQAGMDRRTGGVRWSVALAVAVGAMVLTKGPAGLPLVLGAMLGVGWAARPGFVRLLAVGLGAMTGVILSLSMLERVWSSLEEPAVRQGVGSFLWERGKLLEILLISPTVLATMLPASLALLFPWGPDASRERAGDDSGDAGVASRALALSCVAVLVVFEVSGVSNARYGLPLCALLTPLVAYVARGAHGSFVGKRPAIARAMLLGRAWVWPVLLLVGAGVYIGVLEPHRRASSGRGAGVALAAHLPDGAEVWADEMIEARPEVLLYAAREAAREGRQVRVRWIKPEFMPAEHPEGLLLLLREDDLIDEVTGCVDRFGSLTELARGEVHKYRFVLCAPGP